MIAERKDIFLFLLFCIFLQHEIFCQSGSHPVLSEVMFRPAESNGEFVEIFNPSLTDTLDLSGIKLKYYTSAADSFTEFLGGTKLLPGKFAVLIEGDYDLENGLLKEIIPEGTVIMKTADNAFGSGGMSNSSDRSISLLDASGGVIDEYVYSADNAEGISDEKINMEVDGNAGNWANSLSENGTPGRKNSVSPKECDAGITGFAFADKYFFDGEPARGMLTLSNFGKYAQENYTIRIFRDLNSDSLWQASEPALYPDPLLIQPGETLQFDFAVDEYAEGINSFVAEVDMDGDEAEDNDRGFADFEGVITNEQRGDLVINEIMYSPRAGEPEWFEIFNASDKRIDFENYSVADERDTVLVTHGAVRMLPGEYLVVARDSVIREIFDVPSEIVICGFPSLSNTSDAVILLDKYGRTIDSVKYNSSWGGKTGISLERISAEDSSNNSDNWSGSKISATPGKINSVSQKLFDAGIKDFSFNPAVPVTGDLIGCSVSVKNRGKYRADFNVIWGWFDRDMNQNVIEISEQSLNTGDSVKVIFDRKFKLVSAAEFFVRILFEADQDTSDNFIAEKLLPTALHGSLVINEIMFDPAGGEPEWFELYNNNEYDIDLAGWKISDVLTTPVEKALSGNELIIHAHEYLLVAKDSSLVQYYESLPQYFAVLSFANLNNDRDGLVLRDFYGSTIDSVFYDDGVSGSRGKSLERISAISGSDLIANWLPNNSRENGTPGRINSVTPKENDVEICGISTEPEFPVLNESIAVICEIVNRGRSRAENLSVRFSFITGDGESLLGEESNISINPDDTAEVVCANPVFLSGRVTLSCRAMLASDEDTVNNFFEKTVIPGASALSVIINEIMFNPLPGESEWIEILNVSGQAVNLKGWTISDARPSPSGGIISDYDIIIQSGQYAVLTSDSLKFVYEKPDAFFETAFGTLGNTADGVILRDFRNAVIDRVDYDAAWGAREGYSIERISADGPSDESGNWCGSLSTARATPGKMNSIAGLPATEFNSVVINEIMYDPAEGNCEFIELYNRSEKSVQLGGWKFVSGPEFYLSRISVPVGPGEYFLLAADSSIFMNYNGLAGRSGIAVSGNSSLDLSNSGESIYLKDYRGAVIDSLTYSPEWHNSSIAVTKNISLERINPFIRSGEFTNWSSSANASGATPGRMNSVYAENIPSESRISVSPNPFSPDNDGFEDFSIINLNLSERVSSVRIKVYDASGRLVRTLVNNRPAGVSSAIIFDGRDDDKTPLRIGIYILFVEITPESGGEAEVIKAPVVIARKL